MIGDVLVSHPHQENARIFKYLCANWKNIAAQLSQSCYSIQCQPFLHNRNVETFLFMSNKIWSCVACIVCTIIYFRTACCSKYEPGVRDLSTMRTCCALFCLFVCFAGLLQLQDGILLAVHESNRQLGAFHGREFSWVSRRIVRCYCFCIVGVVVVF